MVNVNKDCEVYRTHLWKTGYHDVLRFLLLLREQLEESGGVSLKITPKEEALEHLEILGWTSASPKRPISVIPIA